MGDDHTRHICTFILRLTHESILRVATTFALIFPLSSILKGEEKSSIMTAQDNSSRHHRSLVLSNVERRESEIQPEKKKQGREQRTL